MNVKSLVILVTLLTASTLFGEVTINPGSPLSNQIVTIRVSNTFGAEASAGATVITQVGKAFTIHQTVNIACSLPSNPVVMSEFQVGPLAPGSYTATAIITFASSPILPCPWPAVTQTASFTVAPAAAIPTLSEGMTALLLLALVLVGQMNSRG